MNPDERIAHAETFFAALGATVLNGGNSAYYSPRTDHIQMPLFGVFFDAQGFYATRTKLFIMPSLGLCRAGLATLSAARKTSAARRHDQRFSKG